MQIPNLGLHIINEAESWLTPADFPENLCLETGNNRGPCIDEITKKFYGKPKSEYYCSIAAYVIVQGGCDRAGVQNQLLHSASGMAILADAQKKGLTVDKQPMPGAFMQLANLNSKGKPTGKGHSGIVVWVDDNYYYTIEGNGQLVDIQTDTIKGQYQGIFSYKRNLSDIDSMSYSGKDYDPGAKSRTAWFIHTEMMDGTGDLVDYNVTPNAQKGFYVTGNVIETEKANFAGLSIFQIALLSAFVGGIFYGNHKKKF